MNRLRSYYCLKFSKFSQYLKCSEQCEHCEKKETELINNEKTETMNIRAKIQISSAFKAEGYEGEQINAHAVYGNSTNAEDNTFSATTPWLNLQMCITNPAAIGQLQKGRKYYIDFTEAPE